MTKKVFLMIYIIVFSSNAIGSNLFNYINEIDLNHVIWVEKSTNKLTLIDLKNKKIIFEEPIAYGIERGDKKEYGDKRTPEGVYRIIDFENKFRLQKKYGKSNVERYGEGAFILNYPNEFDKKERKTGNGIWIHGIDSQRDINDINISLGCVILKNKSLLSLRKKIKSFDKARVVIVDKNPIENENKISNSIMIDKYYFILNKGEERFLKKDEKLISKNI